MKERNAIFTLAKLINEHRSKMEALGMFTGDRELLECNNCNLVEDVTIDGELITYDRTDHEMTDTRLRFEQLSKNVYQCPVCGERLRVGDGE